MPRQSCSCTHNTCRDFKTVPTHLDASPCESRFTCYIQHYTREAQWSCACLCEHVCRRANSAVQAAVIARMYCLVCCVFTVCKFVVSVELMHGIAAWFDVSFNGSDHTIKLSTGPYTPGTHWYQCRLLLRSPIAVNATQAVSGHLKMTVNDKFSYHISLTSECASHCCCVILL